MKNNKAFTLIELMVAIAIIGILAGVILVSMNGQKKRAIAANALRAGESVMPAFIECSLRGKTIGQAVKGVEICNGSGIEWPSLETSQTAGCKFVVHTKLDSGNPNNSFFSIYCDESGVVDKTGKGIEIECAGTASPWGGDSKPGNCIQASY